MGSRAQIKTLLSLVGLILTFGGAGAQQTPPPAAQNPYLMGSEGYGKGLRGLTSFQPIAIDQPFAARMAQDVAAKPGPTTDAKNRCHIAASSVTSAAHGVRLRIDAGSAVRGRVYRNRW